jgi:hypothetical protein
MAAIEIIKTELSKLYKGEQSTIETENNIKHKVKKEMLAEFIVDAFERGWITRFNLGLDDDGNII